MKVTTRLMLIACLALPLLVACQSGEEEQQVAVKAPLTAPATNDDNAWGEYLSDVVTRNMEGITSNPYLYYLPAEDSPDFEGSYERLKGEVDVAMQRGILEGNLVAFGSPAETLTEANLREAYGVRVRSGAKHSWRLGSRSPHAISTRIVLRCSLWLLRRLARSKCLPPTFR